MLHLPGTAVVLQKGVDVVPQGLQALLHALYAFLLWKVLGQVQLSQELLQRPQILFTLRRSQVRWRAEGWGGRAGGQPQVSDKLA